MFTFYDHPPRVVDELDRMLTAVDAARVEIRLPERPWLDPDGRTRMLPPGDYQAAVRFSEWREGRQATLVITYDVQEQVRTLGALFRAEGPVDTYVIGEGMAVLYASQSAIARRFDHVEVHAQGIGPEVVLTGDHAGIGERLGLFLAQQPTG